MKTLWLTCDLVYRLPCGLNEDLVVNLRSGVQVTLWLTCDQAYRLPCGLNEDLVVNLRSGVQVTLWSK